MAKIPQLTDNKCVACIHRRGGVYPRPRSRGQQHGTNKYKKHANIEYVAKVRESAMERVYPRPHSFVIFVLYRARCW